MHTPAGQYHDTVDRSPALVARNAGPRSRQRRFAGAGSIFQCCERADARLRIYPADRLSAKCLSADEVIAPDEGATPERLRRAVVAFGTPEAPGTIVIDTSNTALYYVLGQGRAIRYGVGVGREGFTWSGVQTVSRKAEWPDWHPPAEMIARQPYLPRFMAGGPGNPLGARAMYLGNSDYRIHGTNDPSTIGKFVSIGCIRLTNEDVTDLFSRVNVGTKVVVLPKNAPVMARGTRTARFVRRALRVRW